MAELIKEDDGNLNDEELVIVEDEAELSEDQEEQEEDERVASYDDEQDDEREAIRERRRHEKQERKVRRDEAIKRDKLELDFLRKRNDDLERRVSVQEQRAHQIDLSAFDTAISRAASEAEMAERVIAKAVEAGNGDDVAQAMRYRDQAIAKVQQLNYQKQQAAYQKPQPQQIDDMTIHHAQEFIREHPWYDVQGRDEDSAIVIAIDQSLAKEGFDSQTEDYWTELRKRVARRLPERSSKTKNRNVTDGRREPRGGPTVGSGREYAPTSTRKEVYISPERKQALIDAGVWDDPVLRTKYVKRYAEYDKNNR